MEKQEKSAAYKASRIAFQTAMIQLDLERSEIEKDCGLNTSSLNRTINGENPDGWVILGEYFAQKGYKVKDLDMLSLPVELSMKDLDIETRRLICLLAKTKPNEEQRKAILAIVQAESIEAKDEETAEVEPVSAEDPLL